MKKLIQILSTAGSKKTVTEDWGKLPYFLTFFANCLWPIGWIYCNQQKISFAQSTIARGICTLLISYMGCLYTGQPNILSYSQNFKLLLTRSIVMTFHSLCTGFAQFVLPLPVCHCIACSGTIYIFIIDYFMNGTKINHKQLVGIIVGIAGVIIVSNGKLLTKFLDPQYEYKTTYQNYLITDPVQVTIFTSFYVLITVGWAYGIVITRLANANTFQINFILGFVFMLLADLIYPYMSLMNYHPSSIFKMFKVILFTGLPCFIVQILVIAALTMTKQTGVMSLMGFSMVLVSYLISIFRYHETPNLICFIGIMLVIGGCARTILNISVNIKNTDENNK